MQMAKLNGRFLDDFARGGLARFIGQQHGRRGFVFIVRKCGGHLLDDFHSVYVADDYIKDIARKITGAIVAHDVVPSQFVKNIGIADHRVTIRACGVSALEEPPPRTSTRVVLAHIDFAANDIQFLGQLSLGQCGVLHNVAQNINCRDRAGVGHIYIVYRAVEGRVGVHITAGFLDFQIDAPHAAGFGAFKKHVLENV